MPIVCTNGMCRYNGGPDARTTRCSHPFRLMKDCADAQVVDINRPRSFHEQVYEDAECQCGRRKKPGYMLCFGCFEELPPALRAGFFSKRTRGDAYECAVAWLGATAGRRE